MEIKQKVKFWYTNYKGVTEPRIVTPHQIEFGSTEWHQEEQWLLVGWCHDRQAFRKFAMKDMGKWEALKD